jgi:hypothetical protein
MAGKLTKMKLFNKPVSDADRARPRLPHWAGWVLALVIALLAVRLVLPYAIQSWVNHLINQSQTYTGKIGDVKLRLWRGGYRIQQIQILRKSGQTSIPLFSAPEVDLTMEWREIIHGSFVGTLDLHQPRVNFAISTNHEENGQNEPWGKFLQRLFPFKLNRVEITDGEIHLQNPTAEPPYDVYLRRIFATATNLTNDRNLKQALPSGLAARSTTSAGGELTLEIQMNLLKDSPTYEINCGLTNVDLVALNSFLHAYGKFDVARGKFALFTSVAADQGAYQGYVKVFFRDLDVFQWEQERKKNILAMFWQAIVAGVTEVFTNHFKDQLATKIPITGSYGKSQIGIWTATGTLLENAFVRALLPRLDQPVTVKQVDSAGAQ